MKEEDLKDFLEDKGLACMVDAVAKRYGKTPYEVVTQMTIYEFNFNSAILAIANIEENRKIKNIKTGKGIGWNKLGIKRTVIKKPKGAK